MARKPVCIKQRFWTKILKTNSCWIWQGPRRGPHGYGTLGRSGRGNGSVYAHRLSWEIHFGEIPPGVFVCHNCPGGDNKGCVNPKHLFLGTNSDNIRDAIKKSVQIGKALPGIENGRAVLSELDVKYIRECVWPAARLAKLYEVTEGTVRSIRARKLWRHVK